MRIKILTAMLALNVVALLFSVAVLADGTVTSAPPPDPPKDWKITHEALTYPYDGATAHAEIVVTYLRQSGAYDHSEVITVTGAELLQLISAENSAAAGEVAGWGPGRKRVYRLSKWLLANGKISNVDVQ